MMVQGHRRVLVILGCSLAFIAAVIGISGQLRLLPDRFDYIPHVWTPTHDVSTPGKNGERPQKPSQADILSSADHQDDVAEPTTAADSVLSETYIILYSNTTADGRYFLIDFGVEYQGMNPNIIAHPTMHDTWFVVAMQYQPPEVSSVFHAELVCEANFFDGILKCTKSPVILPIAGTLSSVCEGDIEAYNMNIGPHDARVFIGPETPYIIYGSQAEHACFGQWMQDFRRLVDWDTTPPMDDPFRDATDLQRPPPWGALEKNWFVFWDVHGEMYLHHNIAPRRVFTKLNSDGSISEDLAPLASAKDEVCWQKHLETKGPAYKSIHQATNSLSITLCNRSDSFCESKDDNTLILEIFQHKDYNHYHATYEPYVILFKPTAPFELYAVSSKPIWVHGRGTAGEKRPIDHINDEFWVETEMIYVTSISWKTAGQNYHGYLDDIVFLGFGIEDAQSGGIDVVAADLLRELILCDS